MTRERLLGKVLEDEKKSLGQDARPRWITILWLCGRLWQACNIPLNVSFQSAHAELLNDFFSGRFD